MKLLRTLLVCACLIAASLAVWADKININEADAETLAALNGIGASRAEAIVRYREERGAFETLEDLANVKGIGLVTVEKNRHVMTIGNEEDARRRVLAD
jgi:competence protein ComEA